MYAKSDCFFSKQSLLRKERDSFSAALRKRLRRWRTKWVLILSSLQKNSAKTRIARLG